MEDKEDSVADKIKRWFRFLVRGCRLSRSSSDDRQNYDLKESDNKFYPSLSENRLVALVDDLRVGVSNALENKTNSQFKDCLTVDRVSSKLSFLDNQIRRVNGLRQAANLDPAELVAHCKNLNSLIDCIREDVFNAYLQLTPQQKLKLLDREKQMACIFAVLGILESEVTGFIKSTQPEEERIFSSIKTILKPTVTRLRQKKVARRVANVLNYPSKASLMPIYYFTVENEGVRREFFDDDNGYIAESNEMRPSRKDQIVLSWESVAKILTNNPIVH